ncbi:MAG: hypothetical protein ACFFC7_29915 [Candidatus Hermodarchaeota archaeon]
MFQNENPLDTPKNYGNISSLPPLLLLTIFVYNLISGLFSPISLLLWENFSNDPNFFQPSHYIFYSSIMTTLTIVFQLGVLVLLGVCYFITIKIIQQQKEIDSTVSYSLKTTIVRLWAIGAIGVFLPYLLGLVLGELFYQVLQQPVIYFRSIRIEFLGFILTSLPDVLLLLLAPVIPCMMIIFRMAYDQVFAFQHPQQTEVTENRNVTHLPLIEFIIASLLASVFVERSINSIYKNLFLPIESYQVNLFIAFSSLDLGLEFTALLTNLVFYTSLRIMRIVVYYGLYLLSINFARDHLEFRFSLIPTTAVLWVVGALGSFVVYIMGIIAVMMGMGTLFNPSRNMQVGIVFETFIPSVVLSSILTPLLPVLIILFVLASHRMFVNQESDIPT